MVKTFLVIVLIFGSFYFGKTLSNPSTCGAVCGAQITSVAATEFNQIIKKNHAVILDVRTPQEYEGGHIEKAVNIDFNDRTQFESSLDSLDKTKTYLIYCRSGNRSGQAMELMKVKGFTNLINLTGGIQSWQSAGFILAN